MSVPHRILLSVHTCLNKGMGKIKISIFGVKLIFQNFSSLDMRCQLRFGFLFFIFYFSSLL